MTRKPRRWMRTVAAFAVAAVSILAVLLALAYWRLSSGAVSLDWFEGRIEEALNSKLAPLVVDLEQGSLRWSGMERPVSIRFGQARVTGSELTELANLAGLAVDLSARALVNREIILTGLEIERLRLKGTREQDGSLSFALGDRSQKTGMDSAGLVSSLLEPPQSGTALGQLEHFGIHSLDLDVEDRRLGVSWGAKDVELELERNRTEVRMKVALVPVLEKPLGRITADAIYSFESQALGTRMELDALEVASITRLVSTPELAEVMKGPLSGWVEVDFFPGLEPRTARFEVAGDPGKAAGSVDFTAGFRSPTATLELAGIQPWNFAGVSEGLAMLDNLRTFVSGTVDLVMEDGGLKRADIALAGDPGQLGLPGVYDRPLALGTTTIKGSLQNSLKTIRVDELQTTLGASTVILSLQANKTERGYDGSLRAHVDRLTVDRLATYWPPQAARAARNWVVENIPDGEIGDLRCELTAQLASAGEQRGLRVRDLAGSFDMHGLSVRALAPQPPVTGVQGRGTFDEQNLHFEIEGGRLGGVEIGGATVAIGDFDSEPVTLRVQADLRTEVATALEVLNAEPLAVVDAAVIAADDVSGRAKARLRVDLPLTGSPAEKRVGITAEATIEGFGWRQAPLDLELSDGDLELSLADSALQIRGQVSARGFPTTVDYRADLVDPRKQIIEARARLTKEDRDRLGIPDQSVITGPVAATVRVVAQPETAARVAAEIDLTESEIDLPFTSWNKPSGDSGRATLEAVLEGADRWSISSLDISAGDLVVQARAAGSLQPVRLRSLNVERLDFAKNRLHGSITSDDHDAWQARVTGEYLDIGNLPRELAATLKRRASRGTEGSQQRRVALDIQVDEVATNGEVILKMLSGKATFEGPRLGLVDLRAETRRGYELSLEAGSRQGVRRAHLASGDSGDLMKTLGVTSLFEGGELDLIAERATPEAATVMHLDITDLGLKESPILGDILRFASLDGLLATLEGEGFHFKKVDFDLELADGILQMNRGRAYGQGIAITASGSADLASQIVSINGIVARMGLVQRAISKIPVVSKVLLGRRKSGFMGTQFQVSGPMAEPEVEVYPLSTLTPGILRELFGTGEPDKHP